MKWAIWKYKKNKCKYDGKIYEPSSFVNQMKPLLKINFIFHAHVKSVFKNMSGGY